MDNEIAYEEYKLSQNRTGVRAIRSSEGWIRANLNDNMKQATRDIARAHVVNAYEVALKTAKRIYGIVGSGNNFEENVRLMARYDDWRKFMLREAPASLSACIDICAHAKSLNRFAEESFITHYTAKKLLTHGLNEYCIMAGWGDQLRA